MVTMLRIREDGTGLCSDGPWGGIDIQVRGGECVSLGDPGLSMLVRGLAGQAPWGGGTVHVRHCGDEVDLRLASPWLVAEVRRVTIGHVGEAPPVLPRLSALDAVAEPAIAAGRRSDVAWMQARRLLAVLRLPECLRSVPLSSLRATDRQRVAVARGFAVDYPVLLLDEPTAGLDADGRAAVIRLVRQAKRRGSAIVGVFDDGEVEAAVADRVVGAPAFPAVSAHDAARGDGCKKVARNSAAIW